MQNQPNDEAQDSAAEEQAYRAVIRACRTEAAKLDDKLPAARWLYGEAQRLDEWLDRHLAGAPKPLSKEERERREREGAERRARKEKWVAIPAAERDRLMLQALGDDRLTKGELWLRFERLLPPDCTAYEPYMSSILRRLIGASEITRDREAIAWGPGYRWRYGRTRELEGPIADLDKAFNEDGPAAA